jgi:hypothetical protein
MKNLRNKEKQKKQRKNYQSKKKINSNLSNKDIRKRRTLSAGDGILPKSRKITKPKEKK